MSKTALFGNKMAVLTILSPLHSVCAVWLGTAAVATASWQLPRAVMVSFAQLLLQLLLLDWPLDVVFQPTASSFCSQQSFL